MNILEVIEINNTYKRLAEENGYNDENILDIVIASNSVIEYNVLKGTTADELAFGEFTRRYIESVKELELLLK